MRTRSAVYVVSCLALAACDDAPAGSLDACSGSACDADGAHDAGPTSDGGPADGAAPGSDASVDGGLIPPERRPPWQGSVGVPGGIPTLTTYCTTAACNTLYGGSVSTSTINAAIASAPADTVVRIPAGTFTLTGIVNLKSHVVLRGAGMDVTTLDTSVNGAIQVSASFSDDFGAPVLADHVSWTGNYAQGSSTLHLAATNLAGGAEAVPVHNLVMIDQQSDANCDAIGGYGLQGVWWSVAYPTDGRDRYQHQISYVTAKTGHDISVDPPILMGNYATSAAPQVWFEASAGPIEAAGVEDLTLHDTGGNNSAHGINVAYAYGVWVRNCKVTNFRYDISTYFAVRSEFRHDFVGGVSGSTDDYDFSLYYEGGCLFEDNIVDNYNSAFLLESCTGDAFSYNYTTNGNSTSGGNMNTGGLNSHGGNNAMELVEGNYLQQVSLDNGWGSAFGFLLLRNRITGWDDSGSNYGNYVAAIDDYSMNRYMTFVGNVLGTTGHNTVYESGSTGTNRVFVTGLSIAGVAPSPDPVVATSMLRAMNWDSANGALVNGGSYTIADVPASLLYASKPAFFGSLPWPPVDPTNPTYASSGTNIPAGYRFVNGVDP